MYAREAYVTPMLLTVSWEPVKWPVQIMKIIICICQGVFKMATQVKRSTVLNRICIFSLFHNDAYSMETDYVYRNMAFIFKWYCSIALLEPYCYTELNTNEQNFNLLKTEVLMINYIRSFIHDQHSTRQLGNIIIF